MQNPGNRQEIQNLNLNSWYPVIKMEKQLFKNIPSPCKTCDNTGYQKQGKHYSLRPCPCKNEHEAFEEELWKKCKFTHCAKGWGFIAAEKNDILIGFRIHPEFLEQWYDCVKKTREAGFKIEILPQSWTDDNWIEM